MRIEQIELYHASLKLKHPFVTSLGYRDHANNLFLRIRTADGLEGWGECSPYPPINGETIDTCMVVGQLIGKRLIGKDPTFIAGLSRLMDRIIFGNSSVKSAIDIALHDLAAQAAGQPLYRYLGAEIKKAIYTDYTVSVGDIEQMTKDAQEVKAAGFPVIKVKLGDGGEKDVARIKAIREAVGYDIGIRIDANQGWKVKEAITTLQGLEPYDIQYCEAPISRHRYPRLSKVRKHSPIKIMADESVFDHHDAKKLIDMGLCDYINIKLGKSSGIHKARKIIKKAEKASMAMQIGGFLESRILFTANCHLAHTSDWVHYYDFDSPLFMEEDPIEGGLAYETDWRVTLPETPGLGLTVDDSFLQKCNSTIIS